VEQELLSLIELQSSLPLFSVVPVTQSLVTELQNSLTSLVWYLFLNL
jgi:hypothetical protein